MSHRWSAVSVLPADLDGVGGRGKRPFNRVARVDGEVIPAEVDGLGGTALVPQVDRCRRLIISGSGGGAWVLVGSRSCAAVTAQLAGAAMAGTA